MRAIDTYLSKAAENFSSLRWTEVESDAEMNSEYEINPVWSESICNKARARTWADVATQYDSKGKHSEAHTP